MFNFNQEQLQRKQMMHDLCNHPKLERHEKVSAVDFIKEIKKVFYGIIQNLLTNFNSHRIVK